MVGTILAYVVTIGLALGGLTSLPVAVLGGLGARVSGGIGLYIGMLVGGVLTWAGLAWLWRVVEGGPIPLAVFALCFVGIGAHGTMARDDLNPMAWRAMGAEMWAILLVGIGLSITSGAVRWY